MRNRSARPARRATLGVLAAAMGVLALLVQVASPVAATTVKVDHRIFGLHDGSMSSLASSGVGSLRLWDVGVTWRDIENGYDPLRGTPVYDWTRLDSIVSAARAKHVELTLVLGQTPQKYSTDPAVLNMKPDASGAPSAALTAFRDYVNAAMSRYGSKIAAYQVWNEANVTDFWKGSEAQMAQLTKIVYAARNAYAPKSLVVSAPMATRIAGQRHWIGRFAKTKVSGTPVWKYIDAVALNLYPLASYGARAGGPEDSMKLLAKARSILSGAKWPASLPVWNTEVNYGLQTGNMHGHRARSIPAAEQAANVIRTYVLNAANQVKRVFWYRWDLPSLNGGALGNTVLTKTTNHRALTPAGKAFVLVQSWLKGTLVGPSHRQLPCTTDKHGTYTCEVKYAGGVGRIYWNPKHHATVTLVKSATKLQDELGRTTKVKGGSTQTVTDKPVLVRSHA